MNVAVSEHYQKLVLTGQLCGQVGLVIRVVSLDGVVKLNKITHIVFQYSSVFPQLEYYSGFKNTIMPGTSVW